VSLELVLDGGRYGELVAAGIDLEAIASDWMCRIAPAVQEVGGDVRGGRAVIVQARWIGERYEVQLIRAYYPREDPDDLLFWWTPPEPPPAELMRYAERVEVARLSAMPTQYLPRSSRSS
jgi:hypothetical protein